MVARTPLGRVKGLGAARSGTGDVWRQKVVSYALVPLSVFALGLVVALSGSDWATVTATLANPLIALPLFLFVLVNAVHMRLGMNAVIEDYVHGKLTKTLAILANVFFSYGAAAIAAFALILIALRG